MKNTFSLILTLSVICFFNSSLVFAKTLVVCPACSVKSVREAVSTAQANDTILVKKGFYPEGLVLIDKPLQLIGEGDPVVDGKRKEHVFYVRANNVTINGFTIQNSGASYISEYAGVRVEENQNCQIKNNVFRNNTYSIYLAKVNDCLLEENNIVGSAKEEVLGGNGIHIWYSNRIVIQNNIIKKHRDGLYLEFVENSLIKNNTSQNNIRYGMHFMYSHQNGFHNNRFVDNVTGVAVMYSRHILMERNRFEKSWGHASYGLLLKEINDSEINQNLFYANTIAILADGANRNQFKKNQFQKNGWAVTIYGSSMNNTFTKNNFISNYFDVATNTKKPINEFNQNYWENYEGYDLDQDGWGDAPYYPIKSFSLWVSRYPELIVLFGSPVISFLEVAERAFPVLTPKTLSDPKPKMKFFKIKS